ncbi:MAG: Ig-like domain-containing protein, partial [Cyanobacteria bacterium P01_E01_bin.45]
MSATTASELLFVDSSVENYQSLLAGLKPGVQAIVLDPQRDGVVQITEVLQEHLNIETVHVLSHGSPGCLYLGNTHLDLDNLRTYAWALTAWFGDRSLSGKPSLLLYGCHVAAGDAGAEFVKKLGALSKSNIAASKTLTGSATLGGDWHLSTSHSNVDVSLAFSDSACSTYDGVLPNVDLSDWTQEGPPGNGNWQLETATNPNDQVRQTVNSTPTVFISPNQFIDGTVTGTIEVDTRSDNDFIGFVFGYKTPFAANGDPENDYEFLLFDWKQAAQTAFGEFGDEGFSLSSVDAQFTDTGDFWGHVGNVNLIESNYGNTLGWADNTPYLFELFYGSTQFTIKIDLNGNGTFDSGETIFNRTGTFEAGHFGFYNLSQSQVVYSQLETSGAGAVGVADSYSVDEDDTLTTSSFQTGVLGNDTTSNLNGLTASLLGSAPSRGTLNLNSNGTFTYNPNGDFEFLAAGETATETFSYTVSDGFTTDTAIVTITVTGENDAPTAVADTGSVTENGTTSIDLIANDTDPDTSDDLDIASVNTTSTTGTVTISGSDTVTYDPNGQFEFLADGETASDTFTYTVTDGNGGIATATVTVTITGENDLPVANTDTGSATEGGTTSIDLIANDTDPDTSDDLDIASINTTGTSGTVTISGSDTVIYDPDGQFEFLADGETATDSFIYTVTDGNGGTATATVTVTITGENDLPVANDDTGNVLESGNTFINLTANDTDPDTSDDLDLAAIDTTGTQGLVSIFSDDVITYDPNGQFESLAA